MRRRRIGQRRHDLRRARRPLQHVPAAQDAPLAVDALDGQPHERHRAVAAPHRYAGVAQHVGQRHAVERHEQPSGRPLAPAEHVVGRLVEQLARRQARCIRRDAPQHLAERGGVCALAAVARGRIPRHLRGVDIDHLQRLRRSPHRRGQHQQPERTRGTRTARAGKQRDIHTASIAFSPRRMARGYRRVGDV